MGFYIVSNLLIVFFNIVAGVRIIRSTMKKRVGKQRIHFILRRIIYSGIVSILGAIFYGLILTPAVYYPIPSTVCYFMVWVCFFGQSILLITIFKVPNPKKTTTSSAKETKDSGTAEMSSTTKENETIDTE